MFVVVNVSRLLTRMNTGSSSASHQFLPGFTFFIEDDKHLQFVLSYETYGGESSDAELIIANFTDAKHDYENTCLIKVGEHEWINKKPTSIKWEHAWFIKVKDMQSRLQSGQYVVKHPPVSTRLMNRIIAGARKTKLLEKPFVRVLRDQFLIPYDNDPVAFDPEPFK